MKTRRSGACGGGSAWRRVSLFLLVLLWPAAASRALDPGLLLTQYGHTAWRIRDGYFTAAINSVAQTPDGFIWIGTEAGIFRFDGAHLTRWQPPAGQALPDPRIFKLLAARDGSLWIGTGFGLARWKDGRLEVHADRGRFGALVEDREGSIWAGRTRVQPPLCRFRGGAFSCIDPAPPGLGGYVVSLFETRAGELWVGGSKGVCRWREGAAPDCFPIEFLNSSSGLFGVVSLGEDANGDLLADAGPAGLWRLGAGIWQPFGGAAGETAAEKVPMQATDFLLTGGDGPSGGQGASLWIATERGLRRQTAGRSEVFDRSDGLSGDWVNDLFEDREGNLWVATTAGLDLFRDLKVATWTPREGLAGGRVLAVAAARGGGVWVSEQKALVRVDDAGMSFLRSGEGLPGSRPTGLFEDSRGRLWLGVDDGFWRQEGGAFAEIRLPGGGKTGVVVAIVEDRDGDLWVATTSLPSAVLRLHGDRVVEVISQETLQARPVALAADPEGGVFIALSSDELVRWRRTGAAARISPGEELRGLLPDKAGGLWLITLEGLLHWSPEGIARLDAAHGLPCNDVDSLLPADGGGLWIKGSCGLAEIGAQELAAWRADPAKKIAPLLRDNRDGALAGTSSFWPRAARAADGRLYFAGHASGLQVFDPAHEPRNRVPPPMALLRIVADGQEYPGAEMAAGKLELPALTRDIEIDYAALSFTDPGKVRFRYRLAGADGEWREVGNRREAYFSSLGPGAYRFEVAACNNDGVWSEQSAALAFEILPAFYQTAVFRLFSGLALAAFGWALYRWRVRSFKAGLEQRADERLAERTLIARELHDTLLQGVLSSSMHLHVALAQLPAEAPVAPALQRLQQILAQVGDEGRGVLGGLRSSDRSADDLEAALRRVPGELAEASGEIHFTIAALGAARPLWPSVRDDIYRIAREALVNAYRHSGARAIAVEIEYAARELRIAVRDDGCGIAPELLRKGRENHWGLAGMRERALRIGARFAIECREGAGTAIELRVPAAVAYEDAATRQWTAQLAAAWRRLRPRPRPAPQEEGSSR